MTSSSRSSALKGACAALLAAVLAGCGESDGSAEFAEGKAAFAVRDYRLAAVRFAEAAELAPADVDALLMLLRAQLALGEIPAARQTAAKAEALAGDAPDVIELAAQAAFHAKDYKAAAEGFARLAAAPDVSDEVRSHGWSGVGVIAMAVLNSSSLENRDIARTAFLRAIRIDWRNASAHYHLGRLYQDAFGYTQIAIDHLNTFAGLSEAGDPRVQDVVRKLVPSLRDQLARKALQRTGASRRNVEASQAALKKGDDAWKAGQFKTARLRYNDAYSADPMSAPAALALARAWERSDTTRYGQTEALKCYREASSLRPSDKATAMAAGELAMKLGSSASAVEAFSRAVAASPNDLTAVDSLIRALQKAGDRKAATAYQRYREFIASFKRS